MTECDITKITSDNARSDSAQGPIWWVIADLKSPLGPLDSGIAVLNQARLKRWSRGIRFCDALVFVVFIIFTYFLRKQSCDESYFGLRYVMD